jgi:hypothetical protein
LADHSDEALGPNGVGGRIRTVKPGLFEDKKFTTVRASVIMHGNQLTVASAENYNFSIRVKRDTKIQVIRE